MGVIQVQNKFPAFRFAGESSKDYNVYITDVNVFDSAARDVQSVEIPGRNGAYILDHGRYKNVAVEYDCAIGAQGSTGAEDFAEAVAAVRSWLGSHVGYYRLENDLNPDEYRMAAFTGEIEVDTVGVQMGRFSVKFDCMPQRFLVDGDTAQTITSGGNIENPTAFNARPLLMVDGYGIIDIGGHEIAINDTPIGDVIIEAGGGRWVPVPYQRGNGYITTYTIPQGLGNAGDSITIGAHTANFYRYTVPAGDVTNPTITQASSRGNIIVTYDARVSESGQGAYFIIDIRATRIYGTASTSTAVFNCTINGQGQYFTLTASVEYDGADTITISCLYGNGTFPQTVPVDAHAGTTGQIVLNSSKGSLGAPLYFDLDIGEAYKYESGNIVSVNGAVSFGAELPELPPGETAITFDNTVTQLQVVPRWWRL